MPFPTQLKSDFHGVRSTIQRCNKSGRIKIDREEEYGFVGRLGHQQARLGEMDEMKHVVMVTDQKGIADTFKIVLFPRRAIGRRCLRRFWLCVADGEECERFA